MKQVGEIAVRSGCPSQDDLANHVRDTLSPKAARRVDQHLQSCSQCLGKYLDKGSKSLAPDVPDCHIIKEIGRGRFGVVYKAWSLKGEPRIVALKVLSCPGEMEQSRFDREIAVLKRIDSPWITKCFDAGKTRDSAYYVMDFVEGMHLDEYLATSAPDRESKLKVFERVCRAVAEAHALGVVHRDLKPKNILVDDTGQPHLLDFGICSLDKPDWSSGARGTITQAGDVIGTLRYMSPEQAWGGVAGAPDERTDVWSLGIMLYEIVTDGQYPYSLEPSLDRPAHEAILERIRKELPRLPKLEGIPRGRDLEILLERCLAWEADRRISGAAVLADDLARYCAGKRVQTKPLWFPYRLKRLVVGAATRSRWMFSASFVAAAALGITVAAFTFNVGWKARGHYYHNQQSAFSIATPGGSARDGIVIVGISDQTVDAILSYASDIGLDNVTRDGRTWRAVHGRMMDRLAGHGPRAVVWDYYFKRSRSEDVAFASAIMRLEDASIPVVLAADDYDDRGQPDLSATLRQELGWRLRHGAIVARDMVKRPGEFIMAVGRGDGVLIPSLPMTVLAAVIHPRARLDLEWQGRDSPLSLLYELEPGAYHRGQDRINLSSVFDARDDFSAAHKGDLVGCSRLPLSPVDHWAGRTVPYEDLLAMSDEALDDAVRGKVLLFGDFRRPRFLFLGDRQRVRYGMKVVDDVPGCYLVADAISGLLDGEYMKSAFPLPFETLLVVLIASVVGCLLPIKLATTKVPQGRRHRHLLWGLLGVCSASFFAVMIVGRSFVTVHVGLIGFALLIPFAGSLWVELARNRHRILDSHRRAIDELIPADVGTVTLAAKRWKSLLRPR